MADTTPKNFEIGLSMAGAISAGAYTAGVVDFMLQALECWETQKQNNPDTTPPHRVTLKVLSGASAGGMTAAITTAMLGGAFKPVTTLPSEEAINNPLYESWVKKIDISKLLKTDDLDVKIEIGGQERLRPIQSLLDASVLSRIAAEAIDIEPVNVERSYIDDELHLMLSVANLRGIPYKIDFGGNKVWEHGMSLHADRIHFIRSKNDPKKPYALWLDPNDYGDGSENTAWKTMTNAALASGAFPVGLAPVKLDIPVAGYSKREWPIPQEGAPCQVSKPIPPNWPKEGFDTQMPFEFMCVDGGLMNNEPFEMARSLLAKGGRNERDGERADKAVIMIDPFPEPAEFETAPEYDTFGIINVITQMFGALKNQARFKPDELELAQEGTIYSRFMIAPVRKVREGVYAQLPIACGALGGFGGFLSHEFRQHDFQLGRRNAQQFFRRHFALPETNPLFNDWDEAMKARYRFEVDGQSHLPILPVMAEAAEEIHKLPWPQYPATTMKNLKTLMKKRVNALFGRIIDDYLVHDANAFMKPILRWGIQTLLAKRKKKLLEWTARTIKEDLEKHHLMR